MEPPLLSQGHVALYRFNRRPIPSGTPVLEDATAPRNGGAFPGLHLGRGAKLSHPSNTPVSSLRKFVHVRYVDRSTLTSMSNRGTRVQPEVRSMATAYLKSIGTR